MKMYTKKLNSLEELKREQQVLRYAAKHTGSEDWLNFKDLGMKDSSADAAGAGMMGTLISALGSKSLLNSVLAMAPPLLTMATKSGHRRKSNVMERMAKEVLFGYVKWKAIQMTYRGVMMVFKSNKPHEEEQVTIKRKKERR